MPTAIPRLDMNRQEHVQELLGLLANRNIEVDPAAVAHACKVLTDDWLTLSRAFLLCSLTIGSKRITNVSLFHWVEIVQSLFELRSVRGIEEQSRRLRLPSHERLDTALVIIIAGRYQQRGFNVSFEPNGSGCSDLLLEGKSRIYVEVKRENVQEHQSPAHRQACAFRISEVLSRSLVPWLDQSERRLEVMFSTGFSLSLVDRICDELMHKSRSVAVGDEQPLTAAKGSQFVVLEKQGESHFQKGVFTGCITIKQAGVPVQVIPANMPVRIGFDWRLNLRAIGRLIKKASLQLTNDLSRDGDARGFIVLEALGGDRLLKAIIERTFPGLPNCCMGITMISDPGYVIPREKLAAEFVDLMGWAGTPRFEGGPPTL
jgi:hypothetical protein